VSIAARQAGFTHLGRFSALYRKTYGENPSVT
jgi:AraC-like DNA-binding protein